MEHVGGPRTQPLPPPQKVIDHDNVIKSIPQMTNFPKAQPTAPADVEPVFLLYFIPSSPCVYTKASDLRNICVIQGLSHLSDKSEEHGFWMRPYSKCTSILIAL